MRIDATTTSVQTAIARLRVSGALSPRIGAADAWAPLAIGAIIPYRPDELSSPSMGDR